MKAFEEGTWYMFTAPGGFTFIGKYLCPVGIGIHCFEDVVYLRNGGGRMLSETCEKGLARDAQISPKFPEPLKSTPLWWTEYKGATKWAS